MFCGVKSKQSKTKPCVICRHVQQQCRNGLTVQVFFEMECVCLCAHVCVGQLDGVITRITEHEGGAMLSCQ